MDTLISGVTLASVTTAAGPLVAAGMLFAVAFTIGPKVAKKAISFVRSLV